MTLIVVYTTETLYKTSTGPDVEKCLDDAVVSPGCSTNEELPRRTCSIEIHCIDSLTPQSNITVFLIKKPGVIKHCSGCSGLSNCSGSGTGIQGTFILCRMN